MKEKKDVLNDKNHAGDENPGDGGKNGGRARFYAAIAAAALAAAALGLAFIPLPYAGVYFLISSVLLEICSLAFSSSQKKINPFPAVKILQIFAYILLFLSGALFLGGLIYSSTV